MTTSTIPFAACHRGTGIHADITPDYFGKRETAAAQFVASINETEFVFNRACKIIDGGSTKKMDAFYFDIDANIIHIVDFKSGGKYRATDNQMAMYVYAVEREFETVKNDIQIIVHVFYTDNPQFNSTVSIPMDSDFITSEFYSKNVKMASEMHGKVVDREASKERTKERNKTEEWKAGERVKARDYRRVWDSTEMGKASIKKSVEKAKVGTDKSISTKARAYNKEQQRKKDFREGKPQPVKGKKVYTAATAAKRAAKQAIIDNMAPPLYY